MGVLERIESIVRASLSDLLERTVDPERTLNQLISEMEKELADARVQMAAAVREGKRLKMLCIENQQLAERWQKKAVLAIQHGKDDLAREVLARKRPAEAVAEEYGRESNLHEEIVASVKSALKALEAKIQEVRQKKDELVMRKRKMEMDRLLGRDPMADKVATFERLEDRIMSFSAEVEAIAEINGGGLTARLREEEMEIELAKLKGKMKGESSKENANG